MGTQDTTWIEGVDYYIDPNGLLVFTEAYLEKRGFCCRQGCRHCPYGYRRRTRASALTIQAHKALVVRLREPETGNLWPFPPGGELEPGESPAAAAERETFEETGYRIRVIPSSLILRTYPFRWDQVEYDVTTYFYLAVLADLSSPEPRPSGTVPYQEGIEWIPLGEVESAFAFHPDLQEVMRSLTNPDKISSLTKTSEEEP